MSANVITFRDIQLDLVDKKLIRNEEVIKLVHLECEILALLIRHAAHPPLSREKLYEALRGSPAENEASLYGMIGNPISSLNKKFGQPGIIVNMYGRGYRVANDEKTLATLPGTLVCGNLYFNFTTGEIIRGDRYIDLSPTEYLIFQELMRRVSPLSRMDVCKLITGEVAVLDKKKANIVSQAMCGLKGKLGDPEIIKYFRTYGYKAVFKREMPKVFHRPGHVRQPVSFREQITI